MGGGDLQLLPIIIFAVIAGFLLLRLRSVLGRRTGTEKRIDPFAPRPAPPPRPSPFAAPPTGPGPVIEGRATRITDASTPTPARTPGIGAVKAADSSFDESQFLKGARGAFEIIVNAFAAGDVATLKPLLSSDVLDSFAAAIKARSGGRLPSPLVAIKSAEIVDSGVEGATALVSVKFVSDQHGDNNAAEEHVDRWTFSRSLKSRDPNWTLVATKAPDAA